MANKKLSKKEIINNEKEKVISLKKTEGLDGASDYIKKKYGVYIGPNYIRYLLKEPRSSTIFTETELRAIEMQKIGSKSGRSLFLYRVRPKINELLETWFPRKKELKKLIKDEGKKKSKKKSKEKNEK